MNSYSEYIIIGLKKIFQGRYNIDLNCLSKKMLGEKLLGMDIGLLPRDLIYLFFDIEKEFGITIPEEDIAQGNFDTINNIITIISNQLLMDEREPMDM